MKIKLIQNIIDIIRNKSLKQKYKELEITIDFLSEYIDFDINITQQIKNRKIISNKTYIKDKNDLQNYLNSIDATKLPAVRGTLRNLQLNQAEFSYKMIQKIEHDTGIKLFMDYGSLLGAVRHKGFIPWDDDMDFCLMRKDYQRLLQYAQSGIYFDTTDWTTLEEGILSALKQYPNQIIWVRIAQALRCYYGTIQNFVWFDIFALDYYKDEFNTIMLQNYVNEVKEKTANFKNTKEWYDFYNKELEKSDFIVDDSDTVSYGIDNYTFYAYTIKDSRRKTDIFPLRKMAFENYEFYVPNKPEICLKSIYNNFQEIPYNIDYGHHYNKLVKYGIKLEEPIQINLE